MGKVYIDCFKCNGTGTIHAFSHLDNGICYKCDGKGKLLVNQSTAYKINDNKAYFEKRDILRNKIIVIWNRQQELERALKSERQSLQSCTTIINQSSNNKANPLQALKQQINNKIKILNSEYQQLETQLQPLIIEYKENYPNDHFIK